MAPKCQKMRWHHCAMVPMYNLAPVPVLAYDGTGANAQFGTGASTCLIWHQCQCVIWHRCQYLLNLAPVPMYRHRSQCIGTMAPRCHRMKFGSENQSNVHNYHLSIIFRYFPMIARSGKVTPLSV